ncbi:MAG: cytidine deaminase [Lachnospiraceae bacterium]|nr:cytidine deaminase [Lachnospiraceae bacterium]
MENTVLVKMAKEAMENAYAPYSDFKVGAALLCKSGKVYTGCNVENASFGATNCAERTAVFKAVSEGEKEFLKIAIVSSSGKEISPCGICLQVLSEFMSSGEIVLEGGGKILEYPFSDFLPRAFSRKDV